MMGNRWNVQPGRWQTLKNLMIFLKKFKDSSDMVLNGRILWSGSVEKIGLHLIPKVLPRGFLKTLKGGAACENVIWNKCRGRKIYWKDLGNWPWRLHLRRNLYWRFGCKAKIPLWQVLMNGVRTSKNNNQKGAQERLLACSRHVR